MTDEQLFRLTTVLTENVQRGIDFLNRTQPADWPTKVNWHKLDMEICADCVWGQLHPGTSDVRDYWRSLKAAGLTTMTEWLAHGFYLPDDVGAWELLADIWRAEVSKLTEGVLA